MKPRSLHRSPASFLLLEVMLSVMVFALGILGLGRAVSDGLVAEIARDEDQRARQALENRMLEIERGPVELRADRTDKLEGLFEGLTIEQEIEPAELIEPATKPGEKDQPIAGIERVRLRVKWESEGEPQSKEIWFYVLAPQ